MFGWQSRENMRREVIMGNRAVWNGAETVRSQVKVPGFGWLLGLLALAALVPAGRA